MPCLLETGADKTLGRETTLPGRQEEKELILYHGPTGFPVYAAHAQTMADGTGCMLDLKKLLEAVASGQVTLSFQTKHSF